MVGSINSDSDLDNNTGAENTDNDNNSTDK